MKLVLIQGNVIANYVGRQQGAVARLPDDFVPEDGFANFIERFRLHGPAIAEFQTEQQA